MRSNIQWVMVSLPCPFTLPCVNVGSYPQARSKTEAELSLMNKEGVIDAVMTDDSDVVRLWRTDCPAKVNLCVALGDSRALTHARMTAQLSSDDTVKIYTADAIRQRVAPSLQREGFVLMAVCCGERL